MLIALYVYLVICIVLGLYIIASCAYYDIFVGPDSKFGYNYKSSISWSVLGLTSVPVVNIFTLGFFIWMMIDAKKK